MTLRPKTPPPVGSRKRREIEGLLRDMATPRVPPLPEPPPKTGQQYANYVGAPAYFLLNQACTVLHDAFGVYPYLVGSATRKREWRDVDVRLMLEDAAFDRLFPEIKGIENAALSALWSIMCSTISLWLKEQTGLPIDFQIQRATEANARFSRKDGHDRQALGLFAGLPTNGIGT